MPVQVRRWYQGRAWFEAFCRSIASLSNGGVISVVTMIISTMAENNAFRLDAIQIEINGELATHHIYSFQELEALRKGGVQKVYTGNIVTGDHELRVTMLGKLENGKDFNQSDSFSFNKGVKPKSLGITLAGPGQSGIQVGDW